MSAAFKTVSCILAIMLVSTGFNRPLPFRGSFLMSFSEGVAGQKKMWPFLWTVDLTKTGMEIKDDQSRKGVSKRIVYDHADSTWLMLIHYNKVKNGTRIQANAMFRGTMKSPEVKIRETTEIKEVGGYRCRKILAESENDSAVMWVTDQVKFDLCRMYEMLCHCGMMSSYVAEGSWYYVRNIKGMVLEVTSVSKKNGASYTIGISGIQPDVVDPTIFDLSGFRISNIPEGANCGPMEKK